MRPSSRIDLAVFQLTPTRTRCDLVILANGRREKIASGLLDPFLSHLKAARDQMAIGGYSIELKPDPNSNATWFTKGTLERFVRFVSTPEILERIDTLESEILQIEEAIVMQTNKKGGIPVQDGKSVDNMEVPKPVLTTDDDKAIVVYKPNSQHIEANWSTEQEGNPKVHLLKVLETRRSLLQKEKGMAFARAVAAGFDIDSMDMLISFSQCFGAARLMDACKIYLDLWKKKHESGQWLEIEAAEAASVQLDIMAMNASGTDASNRHLSTHETEKSPTDNTSLASPPEHFQGQFPNPIFPPWQFQSPPGMPPGYQPYPMGPMPYCPNYPTNTLCLQPAFSPMQDQRSKNGRASRHKRSSCNDKESTSESDASDKDSDGNYSDELHLKKEATVRGKKSPSSGKKKSGMVVIRNNNYISSKEQNGSDGEAHPASRSGRENTDTRTGTLAGNGNLLLDKNEASYDNEVDRGHWQAFQNYLLKENKEEDIDDKEMFLTGKAGKMKRRQERANNDPLAVGGDDVCQYEEDYTDIEQMSGSATFRQRVSGDELLSSRTGDQQDGRSSFDGLLDAQSNSVNGRTDPNDFMLQGRDVIYNFSPSDISAESKYRTAHKDSTTGSSDKPNDDAYIVSLRSYSLEVDGMGRQSLDIDSEFPWVNRQIDKASKNLQPNYEPDYMSLMPERETERGSSSYNPAIDYELDAQRLKEAVQNKSEEPAGAAKDQGPKKEPKDQKMKLIQDVARTVGSNRKGKPTKLSPLDEARARAERMRSYKADLQKVKKEKEEEQQRRLEALKIERHKRIAVWSGSIPGQSSRQLSKQQLPNKLSPISKPSKFTDTEPGSSSPLQRSSRRTVAMGPIESRRLSTVKQSPGSRLSHSVPSLPEELKGSSGTKPDAKASMTRIRRLSEPKMTTDTLVPSVKPQSTEAARRQMSSKSDRKIMSAIISLDRSKAATLPELNIKASKPSDASQSNLAARMNSQTISGNEQDSPGNVDGRVPYSDDVDDFSIIEKIVVTELQKPSAPPQPCTLQVNQQSQSAPAVVEGDMTKVPEQICNHKFMAYNLESSPSIMKTNSTDKQYQAPYARISSVEDPCTKNSEYCKLPPACLDIRNEGNETAKVRISDLQESQMRKLPETVEKQSKESSAKGFKRLLKFGKKSSNSASSERIGELENVSVGDSETDDHASHTHATNEAYTLKNLISQDETPTAATNPKKSSRSFSLLSPFRKKRSEKKSAT
ncbi:hypothetical protein MLD38_021357 [Melastoma candidum]|uniref:Uncharacterized protein n=1 Tax=Melastoma candidum TaxID=119954 RepID=A0ACB9QF95_9MYRT|nr:hypothetical protein MLD38_021357 [Melastoma candidum]